MTVFVADGGRQPDWSTICTVFCFICREGLDAEGRSQVLQGHCLCWASSRRKGVSLALIPQQRLLRTPLALCRWRFLNLRSPSFSCQSKWTTNDLLGTGESTVSWGLCWHRGLSIRSIRCPRRGAFFPTGAFDLQCDARLLSMRGLQWPWEHVAFPRSRRGMDGTGGNGAGEGGKTCSCSSCPPALIPSCPHLWDCYPEEAMADTLMSRKKFLLYFFLSWRIRFSFFQTKAKDKVPVGPWFPW